MTFPSRQIVVGIIFSVFVVFYSCNTDGGKHSQGVKPDTITLDGLFFANERIVVKVNEVVVFERNVEPRRAFYAVHDTIVLDEPRERRKLHFQTFFNDLVVMDTVFILSKNMYVYRLGGSICYPSHLSFDSLRNVEPHFGFIPIDSCKRYVTLTNDSAAAVLH